MATQRLRSVAPSGGDYTSLQGAITGEVAASANLVTADEYLQIEISTGDYSGSGGGTNYTGDASGVIVDGFTTDATRFVFITAASGSKHTGELRDGSGDYTGATVLTTAFGACTLDIRDAYVLVSDLIFIHTSTTVHSLKYGIRNTTGNTYTLVANCLVETAGTHNAGNVGGIINQAGIMRIINTYVQNAATNSYGLGVYHLKAGTTYSLCYNLTVKGYYVNCYTYPGTGNDNVKWKNVVATGGTADFAGGSTDTIYVNCVSGDGTMTASLAGTVTNPTANGTIAFASADSCEITSGATSLINAGADLSSDADYPFSTDIMNVTRPTSAWDVGAWEYIASGTEYTQSVSGSITITGLLKRKPKKNITGSSTPTGSISKLIAKQVTGQIVSVGEVRKLTQKIFSGSLNLSGQVSLASVFTQAASGSTTPSGAITKNTLKVVTGSSTPTSTVSRLTGKRVYGDIFPEGSVNKSTAKTIVGSIIPMGNILLKLFQITFGSITPMGTVSSNKFTTPVDEGGGGSLRMWIHRVRRRRK